MKIKSFKRLLWNCGFSVQFGGTVILDKDAASAFLCCSIRTLDRWLLDNNPCPRALKLLNNHQHTIPSSWHDFHFTHDERLHFSGVRNGYTASDIRRLPEFFRLAQKGVTDTHNLTELISEVRDNQHHQEIKTKLLSLVNDLNAIASESIFTDVKNTRKIVKLINA